METNQNKLRVALLGCGLISEAHVRAYQKHADRARIMACCDLDLEKARQRAEQVEGEAKAVTEFSEILADPEVDAVEVCTPHHLHTDAVRAALEAGKHVLCQKPLAKTIAECDAMIDAAQRAGRVLFYGETNRTMPAAVTLKQALDEGRIGRLVGMQATYAHWQGGAYLTTAWRYDPKITGGGQLLDGGIHYIDLLRHIGGEVTSVSCLTQRFRPELGGEDTAVVNLRFANDALGTLFSSQASGIWLPGVNFAAFGTEGILSLGSEGVVLHRPDLPERRKVLLERGGDHFAAMIGCYLDTVLNGAPNPSPATEGRENLRVVLAAYESAQAGRVVML